MDKTWQTAFFQDLHMHPELSGQEFRTTEKVRKTLKEYGIEILDHGLETGLIAVIHGAREGRVIALRCDMDALPIQEETGLAYASQNPGVMHACGHDSHTAIMLGAALLLKEREKELAGTIKVIFQPAEEIDQGSRRMLATGMLDDVSEFFAAHSYPWFEVGTLGIKEGPVMAAVDRFKIILQGRGSHAGYPFRSIDPVPAMAALIQNLQTIVSRNISPFSSAVVSVTQAKAGTAWNVIPETAEMEGTVRTLNPKDRALIRDRMQCLTEHTAASFGCSAEFQWIAGSDAVINDNALCAEARKLAERMGFRAERQEDAMGGEDFSAYLKNKPGLFIRVGTGGFVDSHHPKFTVDSTALYSAAEYFAKLAAERSER